MLTAPYPALLTLLFLLYAAPALLAQTILPLYDGPIPCAVANPAPDQTDLRDDIGLIVTKVDVPTLHHYAPVPVLNRGAAVIIAPGGGYQVQAWDWEGITFARRLTAAGYHVFVLRYRLPATTTHVDCRDRVALKDAKRAVELVREKADSIGYAANKIAFMGFSAGGHLAGSVAVHSDRQNRPDASILVYPVTIMSADSSTHTGSAKALLGSDFLQHRNRSYYDLPGRVHSVVPPTLLIHASDDGVVPPDNTLKYYQSLIAKGVAAEMRIYANGGHGFSMGNQFSGPVTTWFDEVLEWLAGQNF